VVFENPVAIEGGLFPIKYCFNEFFGFFNLIIKSKTLLHRRKVPISGLVRDI